MVVNILIIKQYVIIGVFPVHTGINRDSSPGCGGCAGVPCTHRDKSGMRQYYIAFFAIQIIAILHFIVYHLFNLMKNINLLVEFRRIDF